MMAYHDCRWCKPEHDDKELFAMLILEGAQAGLSWSTIINREDNYRAAFDGFDPQIVASYDAEKIEELMRNEGIIRNRSKIFSVRKNALAVQKIRKEFGSFDAYLWSFCEGKVIDGRWKDVKQMPVENEVSRRMSADMKKRGMSFVGPVITYSFLQAIGIVNDHLIDCEYR